MRWCHILYDDYILTLNLFTRLHRQGILFNYKSDVLIMTRYMNQIWIRLIITCGIKIQEIFLFVKRILIFFFQHLRQAGIAGRFVEFFGPGVSQLSAPDRTTIANMSPEYNATVSFFPIDQVTLKHFKKTSEFSMIFWLFLSFCSPQSCRKWKNFIQFVDLLLNQSISFWVILQHVLIHHSRFYPGKTWIVGVLYEGCQTFLLWRSLRRTPLLAGNWGYWM